MRIAIVRLSALGDIIQAMIVLQFIKKNYPESEIDWFVEKRFFGILENNPHINQIHQVSLKSVDKSKSLFLLCKELRKIRNLGKYELVIDMQGLIKSALVAQMIPSEKTLGFDKNSSRESLAAIFYNQKYKINYDENIIERNLNLMSYALKFSFDKEDVLNKEVFLYSSQQFTFDHIISSKKNILLIPGASYPAKSYSVEKFVELTKQLDVNFLTIWGNKKERIIANEIKELSSNVEVLEELSLDGLISLISQVDLVIGPDTGPTHMAWALNIPSITLFGPTPGYRNTYLTNANKIIESDSEVNPKKINKSDYSINSIKVDDISILAQKLLELSE